MNDGSYAPSRRGLLAGTVAAVTLAGACRPFVTAEEDEKRDPDIVTAKQALAAEEELLARYAAARGQHADLDKSLAPFVHRHREHRAALRTRLPKRATASPSATTSPAPSQSTHAPRSVKRTLAELVGAERAAAAGRVDDALGASPTLAEVLASIGACEAAHAKLLNQVHP
ncbi:MAG: hypothetical protein ACRDMV_23750 [Streptosporangiales bacterium]